MNQSNVPGLREMITTSLPPDAQLQFLMLIALLSMKQKQYQVKIKSFSMKAFYITQDHLSIEADITDNKSTAFGELAD